MQTHAYLCGTVILMWFHLHATDSFVFIIITRLGEADLFGLVATVMPLCLSIKNNFTTWTFVMSRHHRTRNIRREIEPRTSIKLHFQYFHEEGWKFDWWWSCLPSFSGVRVWGALFVSILFNEEFMWQNANAQITSSKLPLSFCQTINSPFQSSLSAKHEHESAFLNTFLFRTSERKKLQAPQNS